MGYTKDISLGYIEQKMPVFGNLGSHWLKCYYNDILYSKSSPATTGQIIIYNPQTYTASVRCSNETYNCIFADDNTSQSIGYSQCTPPREGDFVLVYPLKECPNRAVIIGRIPYQWNPKGGDPFNDPEKYHRRSFVCDLDNTDASQVDGYSIPLINEYDNSTQIFTQFRPTDVNAGEIAFLNQHNCGFKGGMFSAALHGGGAIIRLSALTNAIRESCEHYMRFSMAATTHEYHNGKYLSTERNVSLYQEERLGWHSSDSGEMSSAVWSNDSERPNAGLRQTARYRIKEMSGFFGHLSSKFFLRPDPDDNSLRKIGDRPKDEGVTRETVDPSGQYRLSAAGMIAIERTGRIPVPVRIALPTDNKHDLAKDPEKLEAFVHDTSRPGNRLLELYDRQAYDLKNQYSRVDAEGEDNPDFYVPQEEDLKPLNDAYDKNFGGNETVKLKGYDKRRAGVYIGEDGSVIIRDAWGSEISMVGGNVNITCAGNVISAPGKTALTIAGDDIVQKAQNSVDIHASEHDVRLSAARNMEIIGGADDKQHQGGVIIESKGKISSPWDGENMGESAKLNGITLKAANQNIVTDCRKLNLMSTEKTAIISGDEEVDGHVSVAGNSIEAYGKQSVEILSSGNITTAAERSAQHVGGSALFAGSTSATFLNGSKYPIPLKWEPTSNGAEDVISSKRNVMGKLSDKSEASGGYDKEALGKMKFGFRTEVECRATEQWEIGGRYGFCMYEPAWVQMLKKFETLKGVKVKKYEEKGEWGNGMPFPGKNSDAKYYAIGDAGPENITDDGFNKSRMDVKKSTTIIESKLDDSYIVALT